MKFQLKCILIETKPRTGYYVANEGTLVSIVKMDMKNGFCKLSNGNKITIDQAKFCVAKLIGEVNIDDKPYTVVLNTLLPFSRNDFWVGGALGEEVQVILNSKGIRYLGNIGTNINLIKMYATTISNGQFVDWGQS